MTNSKTTAWILLLLVLAALIFSIVSLFQGRLEQAMLFTPALFVLYVFGLARNKSKQDSSQSTFHSADDTDSKTSPDHENERNADGIR